MNIQEATKKAMQMDGIICRKSVMRKESTAFAVVEPTNTYDCCLLVVYRDGKPERSARCWNPTADDLAADDWVFLRTDKW